MAALLNAFLRPASRMRADSTVSPVLARSGTPGVCHLTRPRLVARWHVGPDGHLTRTWLCESTATPGHSSD